MSNQLGLVTREITMSLGRDTEDLGLVTREITMSLGGGHIDLRGMDLGLVTNEITMSLGANGEVLPAAPLAAKPWLTMWGVLSLGSALISGYHGYYRGGRSAGSALGWGVLGLLFPVLTPAFALAMRPGFAQPAPR